MIPSSTPQILLLAHDQSVADIQRLNLETLGCQLWQATSFQQARRLLASKPLALLIIHANCLTVTCSAVVRCSGKSIRICRYCFWGSPTTRPMWFWLLRPVPMTTCFKAVALWRYVPGSGPGSDGANTSSCRVSNSNSTASASIVLPARSRPLAGHCS